MTPREGAMTEPPQRIWLQWHGADEADMTEAEKQIVPTEVCWCSDKIFDTDVEYVIARHEAPAVTPTATDLAMRFHTLYEGLALKFGYETRKESARPWSQVPEQNKLLMEAVCAEIIKDYKLASPAVNQELKEALRAMLRMIDEKEWAGCDPKVYQRAERALSEEETKA
jgi:hypothetical protein